MDTVQRDTSAQRGERTLQDPFGLSGQGPQRGYVHCSTALGEASKDAEFAACLASAGGQGDDEILCVLEDSLVIAHRRCGLAGRGTMAVVHERDLEGTRRSLENWLRRKLPRSASVELSSLEMPAGNGLSNETFMLEASWVEAAAVQKQGLVARTQVPGPGLHMTYDVLMQAAVMESLKKHSDVPVPTVRWKEEDPSVVGTPFFVMERVDGKIPAEDPPFTASGWVMDLDPVQRGRLYDNGLRMLAKIHSLDPGALGLGFLERSDPGRDALERELAYCQRYYAFATEGREHPTLAAAFEWIRANRPTDAEPVVLNWGDGRIGNMIFGDDLSVLACLDWELASLGSPEQDLGHWLFQDRRFTEGRGWPLPEGFPKREEVIQRYEEYSGREVNHADFYETLAAFRSSMFHARYVRMMIRAGSLSPESDLGENNPASRILANMLGLPAPAGVSQCWTGEPASPVDSSMTNTMSHRSNPKTRKGSAMPSDMPASGRLLSEDALAALGKSTAESFVECCASGNREDALKYAASIFQEWSPRMSSPMGHVSRFLTVAERLGSEDVRNDVWEAAVSILPPSTLTGLVLNLPLPGNAGPSTADVLDQSLPLAQGLLKLLVTDRCAGLGRVVVARLEIGVAAASAAVSDGRYSEACLIVGGLLAGFREIHDCWVLISQSVLRQINLKIGEDAVLAAQREAAGSMVPRVLDSAGTAGDPVDMLRAMAAGMRGHLSGPSENGSFVVRETDDQFIMELDACGSGGRLRRDFMEGAGKLLDAAGFVSSPRYWTAGMEDVPLFCSHCFIYHEIVAAELTGKESRFTRFNPDANAPCVWSIYKRREDVPAELRNRTDQP